MCPGTLVANSALHFLPLPPGLQVLSDSLGLGWGLRLNFVVRVKAKARAQSLNPGCTTDELRTFGPAPSLLLICERWHCTCGKGPLDGSQDPDHL